jgi:DNA-binding response OmpR family regulator
MAAVQQYRPQVVILDLPLPATDGFLVASTVGTYRRIERRLMLFQREFHSGGIDLQN